MASTTCAAVVSVNCPALVGAMDAILVFAFGGLGWFWGACGVRWGGFAFGGVGACAVAAGGVLSFVCEMRMPEKNM